MNELPKLVYYAHTGHQPDGIDWQLLKDHLMSVAVLAQTRAKAFGAGDWAHLVGLLHDLGKYSQAFQQRLHGSKERADHATAGAKVAVVLMLIQYCPTDPSGCV